MKVLNGIIHLLKIICCVLFVEIVVVTFLQVVSRYFLGVSYFWAEELAVYSMVWLVFLGSVIATSEGAHTRVNYFVNLLPKSVVKYVDAFANMLCIAFLLTVSYFSINVIKVAIRNTSTGLGMPMGYLYIALPISGVLMSIYFAINIYMEFKQEGVN